MSALISDFTDYVRKIWIKYRKIVTSECLSVQVQSCEKASIIGQYSTIQCTILVYIQYSTLHTVLWSRVTDLIASSLRE